MFPGFLAGILFPMFALALNANAVQLINDGGFESGLTGWTTTTSAGSGGNWFADTTTSTPLTGAPTVGPHSGTGYAVTDQVGPGVNAMSQDYTVPVGTTTLTLTFDMFVNDWNSSTGTANVQVLILAAGGNPVTGVGTVLTMQDILVTGGVPNPYAAFNLAISGFVPGDTYTLAFRETDTVANMNVGLDDVALNATTVTPPPVPEPRSVALLLAALAVMGVFTRRRLGAIRHQGKLLAVLGAFALLSQPVHAQSANQAQAVVPKAGLEPGNSRPYAWMVSIVDPAAVVPGPGQTNCGGGAGQDTCFYVPSDVNTAYTRTFISNGNGGAGRTVAVTDAYFNSQTEADLATFSSNFGLPQCTIANGCLTIVSQTGGPPPPQPNPITPVIQGWFIETNLDLQWVHSMAPNAHILLVAANSSLNSDLYPAVAFAKAHADVVTNSWGAPEFPGEGANDPTFASAVPILFSAGDTFAQTEYPCTSPNVTCVGGTHLLTTTTSHRNVESVWDESATGNGGTGGGCSLFENAPAFQSGFNTCPAPGRGVPDIAAIADSFTGVLVFLGNNASGGAPGLYVIGGTSLASPVMAGIVANISTSRVAQGKSILGGSTSPLFLTQLIYQAAVNPFYHYRLYDVTTGTHAAAGWDTATGLGVTLNPALTAYLNTLP
jgi:hypothetical protein